MILEKWGAEDNSPSIIVSVKLTIGLFAVFFWCFEWGAKRLGQAVSFWKFCLFAVCERKYLILICGEKKSQKECMKQLIEKECFRGAGTESQKVLWPERISSVSTCFVLFHQGSRVAYFVDIASCTTKNKSISVTLCKLLRNKSLQ